MSSIPSAGRRRTRALGLLTASLAVAFTGALVATGPTVNAAPGKPAAERVTPTGTPVTYEAGRYVVVLKAAPAASYDGGTGRFARTKPREGQAFRADSAAVQAYSRHLRQTQDRLADSVGATTADNYTVALNGFAAKLTGAQATKLAADKRVLLLSEDTALQQDTWNTPTTLGLAGAKGAWKAHGSQKTAGAGVVVGILDSGLWPESRSFRGSPIGTNPTTKWDITMDGAGNTRMEKLDGSVFRGKCETGEQFDLTKCNSKVISARYYPDAFVASVPPQDRPASEFISPRDGSGHGSHTASTAAGTVVNSPMVEGRNFGTATGMAPGAKLAVYKVCFEDLDPDTGGCYTSSSVAAIDDAVADGVDVINFSISGAQDTVIDPVEIAYEGAAEAGVFIATSAGNSGPEASTVAHNSPWLTTVAAGTHVNFEGTIVLADGNTAAGRILGASISSTPIAKTAVVTAEASVVSGGDAADAKICGPDTLDPAKVAGKVVVCYRGTYDRVAKSAEVERAGGKAMILVNPSPNSLDADFHAVPTIHISDTDGAELATFLDGATAPTAQFLVGNQTTEPSPPLPQVAGFSSRGPALANDADLLKPDLTAPGQSVLAAVAPPSNQGRNYDLYSGTSMAAPHIAGLAAFLLGENPGWTPMEVKSAMMTSATKMKNANGGNETDVFAAGSGQVAPKKFFDPGLFVTETGRNWRGFITGQGLDTGVPAVEANQLNVPSFADGAVAGSTTLTRTFKATRAGTWNVGYYLPGFTVTTVPSTVVSKRANDLVDVSFTFTRTTAPLESYSKGAITLTGPTKVRMPVAMRPALLDVPASVSGEGASGEVTVPVKGGAVAAIDLTTAGLTAPQGYDDAIQTGDFYYDCWAATPGTSKAAVFDIDADDDTADLDLAVYAANACDFGQITGLAGESATASADERVVLEDPEAPFYITEVAGFAAGDEGDPIAFTNSYYDIGGAPDLGTLTVAPDPLPITLGGETSYEASWTGLDPGSYLGLIRYEGSSDTTFLDVEVADQIG